MKTGKTAVPAVIVLALAVISAVGVRSFFGPCVHEDGTMGVCHWAGEAVFGTSLLLAALSLIALVRKDRQVRQGLYMGMVSGAVLGILFPGTLISLCGMAAMRCRALMRPAVTILMCAAAAAAAAGCVMCMDRKQS